MRWPIALAVAASLSCGERAGSPAPGEGAPGVPPPIAPAPFVVFTTPKMVIDQLGRPVPAPVTVGSQPSPETLSSDAPDIVEVTAAGALVARRNGRATVRARGGGESQLEVEARAVSKLFPMAAGPVVAVRDFYSSQSYFISEEMKETDVWKPVSNIFTTGPETKLLVVRIERVPPGNIIRGRLWLDDFELTQK